MQPEYPPPPAGWSAPPSQPAAGWPPGSPTWSQQGSPGSHAAPGGAGGFDPYGEQAAAPASPQPAWAGPPTGAETPPRQGRPSLIILVAFLTEVVLIAAGANQGVSNELVKRIRDHLDRFVANVGESALTYQWRFSPPASDPAHLWSAQLVLIGTVLAVTALLLLVLVRGGAGFGRVFVGTWLAVIVATQTGAVARGFVVDQRFYTQTGSDLRFAFFGQTAPSGYTFVAGIGLGLFVALAAAITAAITLRPAKPRAESAPAGAGMPSLQDGPPVPDGPPVQDAPAAVAFGTPDGQEQPTTSFTPVPDPGEHGEQTQAMPPAGAGEQTQAMPVTETPATGEQPTTQLPPAEQRRPDGEQPRY